MYNSDMDQNIWLNTKQEISGYWLAEATDRKQKHF